MKYSLKSKCLKLPSSCQYNAILMSKITLTSATVFMVQHGCYLQITADILIMREELLFAHYTALSAKTA
jgi:hypothetical protein